MAEHEYRKRVITYVGSTATALLFKAVQADGTDYNLTGLTVTLRAVYQTTDKIAGSAVTVDVGTEGLFSYLPTAEEVDVAGDYAAQVKVMDGAAVDYLEEIILEVRQPV